MLARSNKTVLNALTGLRSLEEAGSASEKREVLKRYVKNVPFRVLLRYAYDPLYASGYRFYHMKHIPFNCHSSDFTVRFSCFCGLVVTANSGIMTRTDLKRDLEKFLMSCPVQEGMIYRDIFLRQWHPVRPCDLEAVMPDLLSKFYLQRPKKFRPIEMNYPMAVTPSYRGMQACIILTRDLSKVLLWDGTPTISVPHLPEVARRAGKISGEWVLDGKLHIPENMDLEKFKADLKNGIRMNTVQFSCHDMVPFDQWQTPDTPRYSVRNSHRMKYASLRWHKHCFRFLPSEFANSYEEIKKHFSKYVTKHEANGVILTDSFSKYQLKPNYTCMFYRGIIEQEEE